MLRKKKMAKKILHSDDDGMISNGLIKLARRFSIERRDHFKIEKESKARDIKNK
jgi:hypothetical protein